MEQAPLRDDLADGPEGSTAAWTNASDGVRLRVGGWRGGSRGTILVFNGRTEYIEKYGRVARDFVAEGYSVATLDWRGQGLSERVATNPDIGHVKEFDDYQKDVAAFLSVLSGWDFPKPYYLIAHSMGGAIGLRALVNGLPVDRAVFSGPMWGIGAIQNLGLLATVLLEGANAIGMGLSFAPSTDKSSYVLTQDFGDNSLTNDEETYRWLQSHVRAERRLGLGGPSMHWLRESKRAMEDLGRISDVPCPVLAMVGTEETVVVPKRVHSYAANWKTGRVEVLEGARHEAMMEVPEIRQKFLNRALYHFQY